jgi:hypothetical protein
MGFTSKDTTDSAQPQLLHVVILYGRSAQVAAVSSGTDPEISHVTSFKWRPAGSGGEAVQVVLAA